MARAITGAFPNVVKVGLAHVYFSSLKDVEKEYTKWINVHRGETLADGTGRAFAEVLQVASLGTFAAKPEGDPVTYDIPIEGNLVRATPYTFALATRMTKEMKADGLYGLFDKMTAELAFAANNALEVQAVRPLNSGFGTTGGIGFTAAGFDSLAMFSTAHTLMRGGTAANRLTTDVDLSQTGLELMSDLLHGTVNESGMPTPRTPAYLIVDYRNEWIARELLESTKKPWTNTNDVNTVQSMNLTPIFSHYLSDPDSWFLLAKKSGEFGSMGGHDIHMWMRQEPQYEIGDDFDTGDSKMKGDFRVATFHADWRGGVGSAGA